MRFLYWPPPQPTGYRNLRVFDRDGYDIGRLVWVVCDTCRVGSINKISISPDHHRQDLRRRMIRRALAGSPGCTWQTTHQSPQGGVALPEFGGVCEHLASPTGHRPPPPGRRPRPVLERGV